MAATLGSSNHHPLSNNGYGMNRPQTRLRLNFGPRFKEGYVSVTRNEEAKTVLSLYYRVYNPSSIRSTDSPPILVIHGGPSLPSSYLYPLVQQFGSSRTLIFYDQLGCGRSSQPEDRSMYSIENAVKDIKLLTHSLRLNKFHMLGHSFGGIVAYEYAKDCLESGCNNCLSLILDSTPSNMKTSLEECTRLEEEIKCDLELDGMDSEEASRIVNDRLRKRSECRLEEVPASLTAAIESRGTIFGPDEVSDYVACPPPENALPPTLLIRGQYDFITEKCIDGWRDIFNVEGASYREEEMSNCAHYCHLEDAQSFGDLIKSHCFINDY